MSGLDAYLHAETRAARFDHGDGTMLNSAPWLTLRMPTPPLPVPPEVEAHCHVLARARVKHDTKRLRGREWVHQSDQTELNHAQGLMAEYVVARATGSIWQPHATRRDAVDVWWGVHEVPIGEQPVALHVRSTRAKEPYLRCFEKDKPGIYFLVWARSGGFSIQGWMGLDDMVRAGVVEKYKLTDPDGMGQRIVRGEALDLALRRTWP